ncbi:MAG: hypothetical protein LBR43_01750 [Spiroplasmataceae bacterium]|nr:hypothetical protein [Spiroplasmataceae bacterium]
MERLNNNSPNVENSDKNNWIKPALLIGSVVLVSGLVIYLMSKKQKNKTKWRPIT